MAFSLSKLPTILHVISVGFAVKAASNWGLLQSGATAPDIGSIGYYSGWLALLSALFAGGGLYAKKKIAPAVVPAPVVPPAPPNALEFVGEIAKIFAMAGHVDGLKAIGDVATLAKELKPSQPDEHAAMVDGLAETFRRAAAAKAGGAK